MKSFALFTIPFLVSCSGALPVQDSKNGPTVKAKVTDTSDKKENLDDTKANRAIEQDLNARKEREGESLEKPLQPVLEAVGKPLEVRIESITSNTDGKAPVDSRKVSNIFSLATGRDPYFNNLAPDTTHLLEGWAYTRDAGIRSIVMSVPLRSVERRYSGTERNMWWVVAGPIRVTSHTGTWKLGDRFSKHARDGFGEQWSFNYIVSKVSP